MNNKLVKKDGAQSVAYKFRFGVDPNEVAGLVENQKLLRADGFETAQISSGAVLEGMANIFAMGYDPSLYSKKLLAMNGQSGHFEKWRLAAREKGLVTVSSLTSAIELANAEQGKEIRGGMGEALANPRVLLVANYHDEADPTEMNKFEKSQVKAGTLLRTESGENDFHAANIATAVGAGRLMLCTVVDGFKYKGRVLKQLNVEDIPKYVKRVERSASVKKNKHGTGGITTKLLASRDFLTRAAIEGRQAEAYIGHSHTDPRLILEGKVGTRVVQ